MAQELKLQYQKKITVKSDNEPILDFDYNGGFVNVREGVCHVLRVMYERRNSGKEIYIDKVDIMQRRFQYCRYGTACMREILSQLERENIELISGKLGEDETPQEFDTRKNIWSF